MEKKHGGASNGMGKRSTGGGGGGGGGIRNKTWTKNGILSNEHYRVYIAGTLI